EPLHLFAVLCRESECAAYQALFACGHDPTRLRAAALRELTAPTPRRRSRSPAAGLAPAAATPAPAAATPAPAAAAPAPAAAAPAPAAATPAPAAATPAPTRTARRPNAAPDAPAVETPAVPLGRDLLQAARAGELEPLVGRAQELALLADIL